MWGEKEPECASSTNDTSRSISTSGLQTVVLTVAGVLQVHLPSPTSRCRAMGPNSPCSSPVTWRRPLLKSPCCSRLPVRHTRRTVQPSRCTGLGTSRQDPCTHTCGCDATACVSIIATMLWIVKSKRDNNKSSQYTCHVCVQLLKNYH